MEAMGFEFSKEMQQDIAAIDLLRLEGKLPGDLLLLENTESDDGSQLAERLRDIAPSFERIHAEEALVWLCEPFQSVVPQATVAAIFGWLAQGRSST